ncbi:ATP-binding protein [Sphingobacterium deserti]|uniref:histidine kinase n=1 Tax=Sphingobacterium deserti TaxID=1229276 RepID=A0A0B8T920_9SPHI|nr:ATP-binding protein [Sphingobacterium deserti]KGE14485.1 multi-sensor signal transduction histidine kinase [Sphingobacterium deserti]
MSKQITESTEQFLSGGGEMGKLIRTMDWSKTALGPIEEWPQSLRTSVSLCLSSTFPILIAWGPETIQIYNDSYRPICGAKHPQSMGENFRICWETALPVVGDKFTRGQHGEGTYITDQRMFLDRYGYLEETWMTFSFAPIRDESGGIGGIFHPITETTDKMLSARRTQVLKDVGAAIGKAKTVQEIAENTDALYEAFQLDLPFLLLFELNGSQANLLSATGLPAGHATAPYQIDLDDAIWPLQQVIDTDELLEINGLEEMLSGCNCGPYEINPHTAIILPIKITGQTGLFGFIIAGVSACRALDAAYLHFYDQLASTFNTAVSNVYAYEMEQKRAEALAEIDRSKTAFFSNVSHEFRTPLTLMLGPLDELLQQQDLKGQHRTQIEATHRNALRLLKLVNNLLDYSRVEAGRVQAIYQKLDLHETTVDLASSFRSIIEKAGMVLHVECHPLLGDFYIDKQMWEKIVLNLLSNAFKYTLEGSIFVTLRQVGNSVVLAIADTGVGIPEKELPHMFERFHRIENTAGRTHEGTGIGLSLVHELVQLHGGEISVTSVEGSGSTFTVIIPEGKAHLPQSQVVSGSVTPSTSEVSAPFIREAYSLLPDEVRFDIDGETQHADNVSLIQDNTVDRQTRILIVDDNSDMRAYLKRLLDPFFTVETASNGQDALNHIKRQTPSLILSDVMMPVMDGKAMLKELRNDEELFRLPVIFLSARAGEEARIDGLEAGADDYLVKPFSAAELLTKVRAQINIHKARGHAEEQLRTLLTEAPVAMAIYRGPQHIVELANQRMLNLWGKSRSEIYKKPLIEAIPALEEQGFVDIMDQVYKTGERFVTTNSTITLSRSTPQDIVYLNLTIEALRNEDRSINGLIAVAADVTEQVLASHELEKTTDTLLLAMDSSNMGFYRITVATDFLEVSPRAREIHAISPDKELTYRSTLQVIIPEDRERFSNAIASAIETKGRFSLDYQIQPLDGSKIKWINSTGKAELDKNGQVISVVGTIFDITESKEDDLRKNDFIGMVSHELKTPLSSLKGYAQMGFRKAQKSSDDFSASVYGKIEQQVQKMTVLINGFLNVSRLDSGKIQINLTEFCLQETILAAVAEVQLLAPDQPFKLNCEPLRVIADQDKIATVITNFLSNAVKYAKNRKVTINCHLDGVNVVVSVQDEGPGIKPAELQKLFDRYYRIEGNNPNISGFGIGLYLSAEIIHRHQGKIWAESNYGEGATFLFSIPIRPVNR